MREISLIADIVFFESAQEKFNFALKNSIRISFWLPDSTVSTFSEIIFDNERIELNKNYKARINLIERDFLKGRLSENCEFKIGNYPMTIGKGKILKVL
ncbi:hypothetical protein ASG22_19995 [Chryseobacterium sp. Leaf405]|uniref:hypothetical protein n=1 Tax=Chryseobacterium sp. Leaf405 TaxID=1736367 RepID=UPI0006F794A1|nr:hypothetical protein [Chryseobacterium sp. Leaf405]KQT28486.1 hypothetical protein ASG22_19995 [Chryseobacterium sp. Leaf405]